ncbi:hypothetical protein TNCV_3873851 [Trichonephila clavipes]|nr:hypothetical protein TNCV_3873851 [Trichonephila clavipes]
MEDVWRVNNIVEPKKEAMVTFYRQHTYAVGKNKSKMLITEKFPPLKAPLPEVIPSEGTFSRSSSIMECSHSINPS